MAAALYIGLLNLPEGSREAFEPEARQCFGRTEQPASLVGCNVYRVALPYTDFGQPSRGQFVVFHEVEGDDVEKAVEALHACARGLAGQPTDAVYAHGRVPPPLDVGDDGGFGWRGFWVQGHRLPRFGAECGAELPAAFTGQATADLMALTIRLAGSSTEVGSFRLRLTVPDILPGVFDEFR